MDEEDRSEIGFAPQRVAATQAFEAPAASTPAPVAEGGALAGAEFRDLVVPADNTIGVKLLRALGWRPGQGVGPRVSATAKRRRRRADPDGGGTVTGG
jgi:G patch domain-containing protein 1